MQQGAAEEIEVAETTQMGEAEAEVHRSRTAAEGEAAQRRELNTAPCCEAGAEAEQAREELDPITRRPKCVEADATGEIKANIRVAGMT